MTAEEKQQIATLKAQGMGYKKIAATIGISENTVKSFLRRADEVPEIFSCPDDSGDHLCRQCGKPVRQNPGRKEKKFCSDACRYAWWNEHRDRAGNQRSCPYCGKEFIAYGKRDRKYCSHGCYIRDRFGGA